MLKMKNLKHRICKRLIMAFVETVNLDNDSVNSKELWNWIKNSLEISETQILSTDEDKLKWIQEWHDFLVAGHPG
jgi:beta-lactamase class D